MRAAQRGASVTSIALSREQAALAQRRVDIRICDYREIDGAYDAVVSVEMVDAIGFDRRFRRMWDFYLAYCEAGFVTGYLDVAQLVLTH